jgi:hypothetical protein
MYWGRRAKSMSLVPTAEVVGPAVLEYRPAAGRLIQHSVHDDGQWWVSAGVHDDGSLEVRIFDVALVMVDPSRSTMTITPVHEVTVAPAMTRWLELNVVQRVRPLLQLLDGEVPLHAGAVAIGERAVLLAADGFGGKSTAVAVAVTQGAGFLADDQVAIDRHLAAQGTAGLRLRPQSSSLVHQLEPALGPVVIESWGQGDRFWFDVAPSLERAPIGAVAVVGRSATNRIAVADVVGHRALTMLLRHHFVDHVVDRSLQELSFDRLCWLTRRVPVVQLDIPSGPPWPEDLYDVLSQIG